jgi:hypothetical protein
MGHVARMEKQKNIKKGRDHSEDIDADGRIIL